MRFCYLLIFILFPVFISAQVNLIEGVPRDTSYTIYSSWKKEKKKRAYIKIVESDLSDLQIGEGIEYRKTDKNRHLKLNVYRPDDDKVYPALIMIHGGGWNSGNVDLQIPMATYIAKCGFVCIPVEYRLIPEALYPAGIQDLEAAVKWVYKHAGKYAIDRNKVFVSGCSAGGQLACLIGTQNKSKKIKAVVNVDGISTFLNEATISRAENARENSLKMPVDAIWLGGTYSEKPKNWRNASALTHVSENSVPVCFINSSVPRFHNGRDEMIQKLDSLNIYTEVHEFDDAPHTFWFFHPWFDDTVKHIVDFLKKI